MAKKKNNRKEPVKQVESPEPEVQETEELEEEVEVEVNDPGDCIGHWAECEECEMCEIQDSCKAMTKNINGEGEDAEKE